MRSWLGEDNPWERVDGLLARLDAASSQPLPCKLSDRRTLVYGCQFKCQCGWTFDGESWPPPKEHFAPNVAEVPSGEPALPVEHPSELVERVAKAIYNDRFPDKAWHSATREDCEDFRGHARAALSVLTAPKLLKSKRAASREGK